MSEERLDSEHFFEESSEDSNYKAFKNISTERKIIIIILLILLLGVIVCLFYFLIFYKKEDNPHLPDPLIIKPTKEHKYTFIYIPGLNSTPESVVHIFTKDMAYPYPNNTRVVIMRANNHSVTAYNGTVMPSWFDIFQIPMNSSEHINFTDLNSSAYYIMERVREEAKLLKNNYSNIYLMGASQGGILTTHIAYSMKENFKCYFPLSGFLPEQTKILPNKTNARLFVGFGLKDEVISPKYHNKTMKRVENYQGIERHYYANLSHDVDPSEIVDIQDYLNRRFEDDNHAKPLVLYPKEEHKYTFFFIPGLNTYPEDVDALFKNNAFNFPYYNNTKIVILRSNNNSVTALGGIITASWFDIYKKIVNSSEDYNFKDINESGLYIRNRIREEAYLLNNNFSRIYLMGFSQGAIMASHIAYSMPEKIMFSIALSGFLPTQTQIFGDKKDSKLFVGFGLKDPAILPEFHNKTMEKIAKFQGVERHYYPNLTHYMSDEEIRDISNYILRRFEDESHAKPKVILPTEEHKYTFFFIPGLGMTPEDVENLFNKEKYDLPYHNNTKIVLMRSNNNSVTVSKGKVRPSWFDVIKFPVSRFEDYNFTELNKSGEYIMNRIREEAYLLNNNYSLIYLMGFSQGAILTSHIAYSMKENLRFYISLSGNLPDNTTILPNKNTTNFLSCFGLKDNRIEPSYYNQTIRKIANFFGFEEKIFKNMTHICDDKEEIKEVNKYMKIHFKEE